MTTARRVGVAVLALIASAFAQSTPGPATGIVHIYRARLGVGGATRPTVSCDAYPIAKIQNGRVYTVSMLQGRHNFTTVDGPPEGVTVNVEPGKEYFVRIDYPVNSHFALKAFPVVVPPEEGSKEIEKLRPLDKWLIEGASCSTR